MYATLQAAIPDHSAAAHSLTFLVFSACQPRSTSFKGQLCRVACRLCAYTEDWSEVLDSSILCHRSVLSLPEPLAQEDQREGRYQLIASTEQQLLQFTETVRVGHAGGMMTVRVRALTWAPSHA